VAVGRPHDGPAALTPGPAGRAVHTGAVAWADLSPTRGREQAGRRPVVVVASEGYLRAVTTLALVLPVTTTDRGWPNHVRLTGAPGLVAPSWAMTEQIRAVARDRLGEPVGTVDTDCLRTLRLWLSDFLDLPVPEVRR
jgi:mRNA interferase MazF